MGNLRQKYTDEEWEEINKVIRKEIERRIKKQLDGEKKDNTT